MSKQRTKASHTKPTGAKPTGAKPTGANSAGSKSAAAKPNRAKQAGFQRTGRGCSIAVVGLLVIVVIALIVSMPWVFTLLRNGAGAPVAVTSSAAQDLLAEQQSVALAQLNSYGWVDQTAGVAHVPIERAMTLLAASELPVGVAAAVPADQNEASATGSTIDLANVNFTDDILPIFQDRCAECHGDNDPDEGLVLTSYKDVMLGSIYGAVVKPGDAEGSYLVEMVSTGKMPKKGSNLTPAQIDLIVAWVNVGAPEHGSATASANAAISGTVASSDTVGAAVTTTAITPENVSFAKDVLPILQDRCSECHGDNDPDEGLVLTSYKDVMLGSIYGAVVKPGDPEGSYLVEMVSTGKMPKKGADLTKMQIDTIIAWINAGAPDN